MSTDTRFERLTNEVVSGGTQRPADAEPTLAAKLIGGGAWVALLGVLAWFRPWILVFVVGLVVSIMLHEFGHFWTARRSGMKATQFFLGFGPRVWSFHRNGVEYGLRAVPLGGFVKIIGMSNLDEVPAEDEAVTYRQQSYPKRMWVITAGSAMHVIIALVTIVGVYGFAGRVEESGKVTIGGVVESSPAAAAGLREGDVVVSIDGTSVTTADQFRSILGSTAPGTTVTLDLLRGGVESQVEATLVQHPQAAPGEVLGFLGVRSYSDDRVDQSWGQALVKGPKDLVTGVGQAIVGVTKVLNPVNVWGHLTGSNQDQSSRPTTIVGAARYSNEAASFEGWAGALSLLAAVNVSVGVFNMFPLLPLDGGHAAVATYERIRERGRRQRYFADVSKMMPIVSLTLALLAFMFLTGLYLDTVKF